MVRSKISNTLIARILFGILLVSLWFTQPSCKKQEIYIPTSTSHYFLDGNGVDWPNELVHLGNDGLFIAGYTSSSDLSHSGHGNWDGLVVRLSCQLDTVWTAVLGGPGFDAFTDAIAVDDGFIVCGYKETPNDLKDFWVVKLNADGQIVWEYTYGGSAGEQAFGIELIGMNLYAIGGFSSSSDSPHWSNNGGIDGVVCAINGQGQLQWGKNMGGSSDDLFTSLTTDELGNIYAVGYSSSSNGDCPTNAGLNDIWYARLTNNGSTLNSQTYGTDGDELSLTVTHLDNTLLISGAQSPLSASTGLPETKKWHALRVSANGDLIWEKTYIDGYDDEYIFTSCPTSDQNFLIAGRSGQSTAIVKPYLRKIDDSGNNLINYPLPSGMRGQTLSILQRGKYVYSASACTESNAPNNGANSGLLLFRSIVP